MPLLLRMPFRWAFLPLSLGSGLVSCAVLLDFDELQGGAAGSGATSQDASVGGQGTAGTGGANGGGGGMGAASGMAGRGGGGAAGAVAVDAGGADARTVMDAGDLDADTTPRVTLDDLPAVLADTACNALQVCAGPVTELVVFGEDCRTLFTRTFADSYTAAISDSVEAGRSTYDAALAADCVEQLAAAVTSDPPQCSAFYSIVEDCKAALGGLSGVGESCTHNFDCSRALACDMSSACPGSCIALGSEGDPCESNAGCDVTQGLYCRLAETDAGPVGSCAEYLPQGAACTQSGTECELGTICLSEACRPIADVFTAAEGFPCWNTGTLCRSGLSCEFGGALPFVGEGTCITELAPLDACKVALPDACPDGHYCSANAFNSGGQCLALPTANQPCANSFLQNIGLNPPCAGGLACVGGICKQKKRIDEACEADHQCYSGHCRTIGDAGPGTCAAPSCQ